MNKELTRLPARQGIKNIFLIATFIVLVSVDQISKYLIRHTGGFYVCNTNISFGIKINSSLFYIIWTAVILLVIYLLVNLKSKAPNYKQIPNTNYQNSKNIFRKFEFIILNLFGIYNFEFVISKYKLGLILILSGAIGNLIDRLHFGCVVDFIDLKVWPVFNLADAYITIGAVIIIFSFLKKPKSAS